MTSLEFRLYKPGSGLGFRSLGFNVPEIRKVAHLGSLLGAPEPGFGF